MFATFRPGETPNPSISLRPGRPAPPTIVRWPWSLRRPSLPPARSSRPSVADEILAGAMSRPAPTAGVPEAPAAPPSASNDVLKRLTVNLPLSLIERARTAVYFTPELTLASLTAAALDGELDRIEAERGQPFPARRGPLRSGRPIR